MPKKDFEEIRSEFTTQANDTGSIQVQIVDLTKRIQNLVKHLDENKKDFSSKRGLLILVHKRRRFLKWIKSQDESIYKNLISELGLRK